MNFKPPTALGITFPAFFLQSGPTIASWSTATSQIFPYDVHGIVWCAARSPLGVVMLAPTPGCLRGAAAAGRDNNRVGYLHGNGFIMVRAARPCARQSAQR